MLGGGALGQFPLGGGPYGVTTAPLTTINWFAPLSDPVRVRPRSAAALSPSNFWQPAPSPFTATGWYAALSEPVRQRAGLAATRQQFLASQPQPQVSFSWYAQLSLPFRKKPGLLAANQSFLSFQPTPIIKIDWFDWLSDPVRKKPGLLVTEQVAYPFFPPNPLVSFGWFGDLSDPVRIKPRLLEGDQIFQARGEFIPISYTARLDARERGDFFLGVLYQFNVALRAYVDIIENDPRHRGNMAIIDPAAEPSIVASIIEPTTAQAAGSPVSMVAGARVAIITG